MKRDEIRLGSHYWIRYGTISVYLAEALATNDTMEAVMRIVGGHMRKTVTATRYDEIIGEARPEDVEKVVAKAAAKAAKNPFWWQFW